MPSWTALQATFAQYMPAWPGTTRSHVTRITGDENNAIVEFTDSPELFGREIRAIAAVDFHHGLIMREVDSWEGRRLGIAVANAPCTSNLRFPTAYGEEHLAERSSPARRRTLCRPRVTLTADDTAGLSAEDTAFEDLAPNTEFTRASATTYHWTRSPPPTAPNSSSVPPAAPNTLTGPATSRPSEPASRPASRVSTTSR
ncbi:hypothetical protein [Streptomyces sp. NPDC050538]|uniref:hypothetical protein n=1 Tax=Streptomyces sp. NPDC050538 TaxID=3365627 RepID=UPI00378CA793